MSEYKAALSWKYTPHADDDATFSRDHTVTFPGGITIDASSAPPFHGNPAFVNPEEAFVASLASCHMLTFLSIAAFKGFAVEEYYDDAVGVLARNDDRNLAMTRVTLHPKVTFGGETKPSEEALRKLHETAHRKCFIANSVKTEIVVEPAGMAEDSLPA